MNIKALRKFPLFLSAIILTFTQGPSFAADSPPPAPDLVTSQFKPYFIGSALLSKFVFDIYEVALYSAEPKWSYDHPFALHVNYKIDITASELTTSTLEAMNYQTKLSSEVTSRYEGLLTKMYRDIKKGDTITAIYMPSKKVILYQNNQPLGIIDDPTFAKCFLDIWVGENNQFPEFHSQLMGRSPRT